MKTFTLWSVAMSVFCSLSLTDAVYEAGRDHFKAGAGNPAAVERTLTDMVGRMAGAALEAPVPAASRVEVASRMPGADLTPVVQWVLKDGRTHFNDGSPIIVPSNLASDLGMGAGPWPAKQKSFGPKDRPDITCYFQVAENQGRRELLVIRREGAQTIFWRVAPDGRILATAEFVRGEGLSAVPNEKHADVYQRMILGLIEMIPPASRVG